MAEGVVNFNQEAQFFRFPYLVLHARDSHKSGFGELVHRLVIDTGGRNEAGKTGRFGAVRSHRRVLNAREGV